MQPQITQAYKQSGAGGVSVWTNYFFNPVSHIIRALALSSFGNLQSSYAAFSNIASDINYGDGAPVEGLFYGQFLVGSTGTGSQMGVAGRYRGTVTYSTWQLYGDLHGILMFDMPLVVSLVLPSWAIDASIGSTYLVYEVVS